MSPSLAFRSQPYDEAGAAGAFVQQVLDDRRVDDLTMVVAWAKFGGLHRLAADFDAFRARGGRLRIVLGIDEGGASRPGLLLAVEQFDEAYVLHDLASRTFHPKIYLARGETVARLLVGSSNATAGGLFTNYEASLEATFSLPADTHEPALVDARAYVDRLLADSGACRRLDAALVEALVADPRFRVATTERRSPRSEIDRPPSAEAEDDDAAGSDPAPGRDLFGPSTHAKAAAPELSAAGRAALARLEGTAPYAGSPRQPATPASPQRPAAPASTAVLASWNKRLRPGDAQHPPSGNPTGNLRLTQAGHAIPWLTWFRRTLFGGAAWSSAIDRRGNPIEVADVRMAVTVRGRPHGTMTFRISHAPHRESGQANHATALHWGPLANELRATDHTGSTVTLARLADGSYRLDLA